MYSFSQEAPHQATLLRKFNFRGPVEALAFTADSKHLVLTARDDNYLHYISLPGLVDTKFNMNANADDFVSFTVMSCVFFFPLHFTVPDFAWETHPLFLPFLNCSGLSPKW